jgi:hypothetical protein
MRIAIVADIHGNRRTFEAVLAVRPKEKTGHGSTAVAGFAIQFTRILLTGPVLASVTGAA